MTIAMTAAFDEEEERREGPSVFFTSTTATTSYLVTIGVVLIVQFVWNYYHARKSQSSHRTGSRKCNIPWAPGAIPILGHALLYKQDPAKFLVTTSQKLRIFQLNLAGKRMVLVCGPEEQRQVASMPESIFSARQAVADIGFEYTLGSTNVHEGTDFHKGIVKGIFHNPNEADRQVTVWLKSIQDALDLDEVTDCCCSELSSSTTSGTATGFSKSRVNFLNTIRRVLLRATVEVMIGKAFLDGWDNFDFISEFMSFQDSLEDVTAKSVVLPRPLALVTMLWPFQRRRLALQKTIEGRLKLMYGNNKNDDGGDDDDDMKKGFWLRAIEADHNYIDMGTISELIVGLLFAAHKNPAIGAAQTYLLLRERATAKQLDECRAEANILLTTPSWKLLSSSQRPSSASSNTILRRACLESLRLTAHSIGGVRTAKQDVTISSVGVGVDSGGGSNKPYKIPQGSSVGLVHIATSLNPTIWGDNATSFDLSSSSSSPSQRDDLYQDEYKFTTFSHGVHVCPGQQLALMMLQLTVAVLLDRYEIELPDHVPPLCFERATLAQRQEPVMVKITKKKQSID
jgi:cytochrome P450